MDLMGLIMVCSVASMEILAGLSSQLIIQACTPHFGPRDGFIEGYEGFHKSRGPKIDPICYRPLLQGIPTIQKRAGRCMAVEARKLEHYRPPTINQRTPGVGHLLHTWQFPTIRGP